MKHLNHPTCLILLGQKLQAAGTYWRGFLEKKRSAHVAILHHVSSDWVAGLAQLLQDHQHHQLLVRPSISEAHQPTVSTLSSWKCSAPQVDHLLLCCCGTPDHNLQTNMLTINPELEICLSICNTCNWTIAILHLPLMTQYPRNRQCGVRAFDYLGDALLFHTSQWSRTHTSRALYCDHSA